MIKTIIFWSLILSLICTVVFIVFGTTYIIKPEHVFIPTSKHHEGFDKQCDREVVLCNTTDECREKCQSQEGIEMVCATLKKPGKKCAHTNPNTCIDDGCKWIDLKQKKTYKPGENKISGKCVANTYCDYDKDNCTKDSENCRWDINTNSCKSKKPNANKFGTTQKVCQPVYPPTSCKEELGGVYTWTGWTGIENEGWDCMCAYPSVAGANGDCSLNYGVCDGGTFSLDSNKTFDANNCDCNKNGYLKIRIYPGKMR